MEQNIKRSEKVVKKYRDDWVDEKGFLHTKITKEIITGPVMTGQPAQGVEEPLLQRMIRPIRLRMRGMPLQQIQQHISEPRPIKALIPQQPLQPKPQLDINAFIAMGKKLMDDMGIDPKELLGEIIGEKESDLSCCDDSDDLSNSKIDERGNNKPWKKTTKKLNQKKEKKQLKTKKKIQKTQNK